MRVIGQRLAQLAVVFLVVGMLFGIVSTEVQKQFKYTSTWDAQPRTVERTYTAPFARANREEDYRIAWAVFENGGS